MIDWWIDWLIFWIHEQFYFFFLSESGTKCLIPFAVIGSNTYVDTKDGRKVRGRKYPWGTVELDNSDHCDFTALRRLLLRIHLSDLLDVTDQVHYENYRCEYFAKHTGPARSGSAVDAGAAASAPTHHHQRSPLAQLEADQKDMESKIARLKTDMQTIFDQKVKEKERKLEETERELEKKYAQWDGEVAGQRKKMEHERMEYEAQKKALGDSFPGMYAMMQEELLRAGDATSSNGGSPGNTGTTLGATMAKKATKNKKSFLEKNFLWEKWPFLFPGLDLLCMGRFEFFFLASVDLFGLRGLTFTFASGGGGNVIRLWISSLFFGRLALKIFWVDFLLPFLQHFFTHRVLRSSLQLISWNFLYFSQLFGEKIVWWFMCSFYVLWTSCMVFCLGLRTNCSTLTYHRITPIMVGRFLIT